MSDDKSPAAPPPAEESAPEAEINNTGGKPPVPPAMVLAFVLIAIVGALLMMLVKNGVQGRGSVDDSSVSSLKAEVSALNEERNRQRADLGLPPVPGTGEPIEDIAGRLKKDADSLVALAGTYQKMMVEKDALIADKNAKLIASEKERMDLSSALARLKGELDRALINGSDAAMLRRKIDELAAQRDALAAERESLLGKGQGVPSEDFEDLKRRFEETLRAKEFFEGKVKELQGDLNKAKLFASSESELLPAAVELFRSLRKLEDAKDADQLESYSAFAVNLGASMVKTVNFATGSSQLSPDIQAMADGIIPTVPEGDLILVVGYASRTGNPESNQRLSSDRATAVAEYFSGVKRPGQLVQAVYVGQTERFSSRIPERNQICEVWHIRKK